MNASPKLLQSVLPSTVGLRVNVPDSHASAQILGTERVGSGTVIGKDLILTVNYLIVGAENIEVSFFGDQKGPGELIAHDFYTGLAVIRADTPALPNVRFQPSNSLQVGQEVFIVASAGENQRRVNTGHISSLSPFDAFWEYRLERGITTTIVNPGLGGGSLFTMDGSLCGIVSLDLNEIGHFTLAIPVEHFVDHRAELLQHGRMVTRKARAWLGVYCYSIDEHVLIAGILPGAPAQNASLTAGDVILAIDGVEIHDRGQLYERIWSRAPGDDIQLQVYNDKNVRDVSVKAGDAEEFFS